MVSMPFRYPVFLKLFLISAEWRTKIASVRRRIAGSRHLLLRSTGASALICVLLVACDTPAQTARPTVVIGFIAGAPTPTIEVFARNRPMLGAALVEPTGRITPAGPVERDIPMGTGGYGYGPSVGVGVGGGSWGGGRAVGGGVGIGVPLGGGPTSSAPPDLRLRTRIVVPDIAAYRANWERMIVRVTFGTGPADQEVADIPAPAPGGR